MRLLAGQRIWFNNSELKQLAAWFSDNAMKSPSAS